MKKIVFSMSFLFCTIVSLIPVYAQKPPFTYTQNWLDNVTQSICMQRSREILQQNNFSVNQLNGVAFQAENNNWLAQLTCQSCGDKTMTTIMLSTSLSNETAVEMRERILYYIATGKVKITSISSGTGKCGWINGQDNTQPADPGRGVTDWNAHYNAVKTYGNSNVAEGVKNRMKALATCLVLNNYAKLYADVSVKIADYGVAFAKWRNDPNNTVIPGDPGCGLKDWNAHFNHVNTNGYGNTPDLVGKRMAQLSATISTENFAKLYADVSVIIATYGTTN